MSKKAGGAFLLGLLAVGVGVLVTRRSSAAPRPQPQAPPTGAPPAPPTGEPGEDEVDVTLPDPTGLPSPAQPPIRVPVPPVTVTPIPGPEDGPDVPAAPDSVTLEPGRDYRITALAQPDPGSAAVPSLAASLSVFGARDIVTTATDGGRRVEYTQTPVAPVTLRTGQELVAVGPYRVTFVSARELGAAAAPAAPELPPEMVDAMTPPEVVAPGEPDLEPDPPTELIDVETDPENDPHGSVGLARVLLTRETLPGWKTDLQDDVREWQAAVGLTPDGRFGVESALRMAEDVGVLPLVRFFTQGKHWDKWSALDGPHGLRTRLRELITRLEKDPENVAHVAALRASLTRDQAQGLESNPAPVPTLEQVAEIMARVEKDGDQDAADLIRQFGGAA